MDEFPKSDINVNSQDFHGYIVLICRSDIGIIVCVDALLKLPNLDVNMQNFDGWSALTWACDRGRSEVVKILLGDDSSRINDGGGKEAVFLQRSCVNMQTLRG